MLEETACVSVLSVYYLIIHHYCYNTFSLMSITAQCAKFIIPHLTPSRKPSQKIENSRMIDFSKYSVLCIRIQGLRRIYLILKVDILEIQIEFFLRRTTKQTLILTIFPNICPDVIFSLAAFYFTVSIVEGEAE